MELQIGDALVNAGKELRPAKKEAASADRAKAAQDNDLDTRRLWRRTREGR
jgi:hypothetical protein